MTFPHYPKSREIYSHTGLRGIAAMVVVLFHFYSGHNSVILLFLNWVGYAVDFFFILSGFILNWVYLGKGSSLNWSSYLKARIARIIPLYFLTTLVFLPCDIFSYLKYGLTYLGKDYPVTLLSNLLMISGIMDGDHHTLNVPAWSISVEFFCYLTVFPLLVILAKFISKKRFSIYFLVFLVLICTKGLVFCYHTPPIPILDWHWNSSFLMRGIFGFSLGFFLCSIYRKSATAQCRPRVGHINFVIFGAVIVFFLARLSYIPEDTLLYAFPFLVFFTAYDEGIFAVLLKLSPLQWLGERSYSIYLWHVPVLYFMGRTYKYICSLHVGTPYYRLTYFFLFLLIVLAISELSYRYIEIPCRNYIRNMGRKPQTA